MTASASLTAPPGACIGDDGNFWISQGHDFHMYFHIFFDSMTSNSISEDADNLEIEMHTDRIRALLASSLTQAPVGGARLSDGGC